MAPYIALDSGPAPFSPSLILDYDQYSPHFQLPGALQRGNVVLAALTTFILLSNVLSVALAGMFSVRTTTVNSTADVPVFPAPRLQATFTFPAQEMYFALFGRLDVGAAAREVAQWTTNEYYIIPIDLLVPSDYDQYEVSTLGIGVDVKCDVVPATVFCMSGTSSEDCLLRDTSYDGVRWDTRYDRESIDEGWFLTIDDPCWSIGAPNRIRWNNPSDSTLTRGTSCSDTFFAMWLETPSNPHPERNVSTRIPAPYPEGLVLKCELADKVVELTAVVNHTKQVLSTNIGHQLTKQEVLALYPPNSTLSLATGFIDVILTGLHRTGAFEGELVWINYLAKAINNNVVRNLINVTHIPDAIYIGGAFEELFRRLFAINLQLYAADIIAPREQQQGVMSVKTVIQTSRVTVSSMMFSISAAILIGTIAVSVVIYSTQRQPIGHLPESLAGMYALLYASNAMEECGNVVGINPNERAMRLAELGLKYVYGPFPDGEHYGVYRVDDSVVEVVG